MDPKAPRNRSSKRLSNAELRNAIAPGKYRDGDGLFLLVKPSGRRTCAAHYRRRSTPRHRLGTVPTSLTLRGPSSCGRQPAAGASWRESIDATVEPTGAIVRRSDRCCHRSTCGDLAKRRDVSVPVGALALGVRVSRSRWDEALSHRDLGRPALSDADLERQARDRDARPTAYPGRNAMGDRQRLPHGQPCGRCAAGGSSETRSQEAEAPSRAAPLCGRRCHCQDSCEQVPAFYDRGFRVSGPHRCRSGEVRNARWDDVDMEGRVRTVPETATKSGRMHRVPLADRTVEILEEMTKVRDGSGLVFPSATGKVLSDNTLSKMLRDLGVPAVPHGFRSSFRDWCSEYARVPREVAEAALAHVVKDSTEAAYARSTMFERRAVLTNARLGGLSQSGTGFGWGNVRGNKGELVQKISYKRIN